MSWHPQILADQLILSQQEGADYAHQIILAPLNVLPFLYLNLNSKTFDIHAKYSILVQYLGRLMKILFSFSSKQKCFLFLFLQRYLPKIEWLSRLSND